MGCAAGFCRAVFLRFIVRASMCQSPVTGLDSYEKEESDVAKR